MRITVCSLWSQLVARPRLTRLSRLSIGLSVSQSANSSVCPPAQYLWHRIAATESVARPERGVEGLGVCAAFSWPNDSNVFQIHKKWQNASTAQRQRAKCQQNGPKWRGRGWGQACLCKSHASGICVGGCVCVCETPPSLPPPPQTSP